MRWHYRARKQLEEDGTELWDVVEYYEAGETYGAGWTSGIEPIGETKEELIKMLEMILQDVKTRPVVEDI